MGRVAKNFDLSNRTHRKKLPPRTKPYFESVEPGLTLGYVSRWPQPGTWIARRETGRRLTENNLQYPIYKQESLGIADDFAGPHLTYAQAKALAMSKLNTAARQSTITVRECVERYLAGLKNRPATQKDAAARLDMHVLNGPLAERKLKDLTTDELTAWRDGLVAKRKPGTDADKLRRAQASANRNVATFKSALNSAARAGLVFSREAWDNLEKFHGVSARREAHFSETDVIKLINAASEPEFKNLIEAGFHTGARYGDLCKLTVGHFDAERGQLEVPKGKTKARITSLSSEGVAFFQSLAAGRGLSEPLILAPAGGPWKAGMQKSRMRRALKMAGLPSDAVFYSLRHTHISRCIENGAPVPLVAGNCGTSVAMIEKFYLKFLENKKREIIESTAPSLRGHV